MRRILIGAWFLVLAACATSAKQAGAVASAPAKPAPRIELWIDPGVPATGDGTRARPLKSLDEALRRASGPAVLHLATGRYRGPFHLPGGIRIEGSPATVLYVETGEEVVLPRGTLELTGLIIQGGQVGIRSTFPLELDEVELSGQRKTAIVQTGGRLRVRNAHFTGTVSDAVGIHAAGAAWLEIEGSSFTGPYLRAIVGEAGTILRIRSSRFEGPATAVHAVGADSALLDVEVSGGRGTGIFAAGGALKLRSVRVFGHEYALLARDGAQLAGTDVSCVRPDRAGIALVEARAQLEHVVVSETGSYGAIQQLGGVLELRHFFIRAADAYGISAIAARLDAQDGSIIGVVDSGGGAGDGIHLRRTQARVSGVAIRDTAGAGVLAAEGAQVALRDLVLERNAWGGVLAETGARVDATSLEVRDAPMAIAVPGSARVRVDAVTGSGLSQGLVWAECEQGAEVQLARARSEAGAQASCVGVWRDPKVFDPFETYSSADE